MKLEYARSFEKDLRALRDSPATGPLREILEALKAASDLRGVTNVKKLQGGEGFYRIRVGDYRIGAILQADTLVLVRFLHRKDIYRYFP